MREPYTRPRAFAPEGRTSLDKEAIEARVLDIDAHTLVLDKPAGLATHPGPKTAESLEDWLPYLAFGFQWAPRLVHRLDKDTSGCLILARNQKALKRLNALFESQAVEKTYWAIVEGIPLQPSGLIDLPLKKISSLEQGWRMVVHPSGMVAQTNYRLLAQDGHRALLELKPKTGRTHQIRVHCVELGHPIVGDPVYGSAGIETMMLHSRRIRFQLTPAMDIVDVEADPPEAMRALIEKMHKC